MGVKQFLFVFLFTCVSLGLSAQSDYVRHTVQLGETVYSIAKKYQVSEKRIQSYLKSKKHILLIFFDKILATSLPNK